MNAHRFYFAASFLSTVAALAPATSRAAEASRLQRIAYNNPGLITDLAVGLWATPLPMDYNGDGLMDLVVVCTDKPSNGTYVFANSGSIDPQTKLPVFLPAVRIGDSVPYPQISYSTGKPVVTSLNHVYPDFLKSGFAHPVTLPAPEKVGPEGKTRAVQWRFVDYDGDGTQDIVVGVDFWADYGWDNAYDPQGNWKNGPLHGYVYLLHNRGTNESPVYEDARQLRGANDSAIDVFGMPSPSFGDFRRSGKLDLICGEFTDGFTYFENIGTRVEPRYAAGKKLTAGGKPLTMDLCMITPVACDFNGDGILDLVSGDEDGRVAFIQGTGEVVDGVPGFLPPRYFRQRADALKFGALSAPAAADWNGDGLVDLIVGDSAGYIGFLQNLGGTPRRWAPPVYLSAGGELIREQAGPNGSIQGPAERKWGYTNVSVADWDGDGRLDILSNGIWGKVIWYRNVGSKTAPRLAAGQPIIVEHVGENPHPKWNWWRPKGSELVTQWRTTPCAIDWDQDGLVDLVMLDSEGYLALYHRKKASDGTLILQAPERVFRGEGVSDFDSVGQPVNHESGPLRLNAKEAGASGRRTFCFTDWDGDGTLDLLVNSKPNINFLRGLGRDQEGHWRFKDEGPLDGKVLAGHSTTPTLLTDAASGSSELIIGAEDGFFYSLSRPNAK
ncbi:MAG TPA: VCBS repeat-containing protein [Opitutaceae bacterium]|nr:VCBS repeat-containing protein [Opitutaceae bacterium]